MSAASHGRWRRGEMAKKETRTLALVLATLAGARRAQWPRAAAGQAAGRPRTLCPTHSPPPSPQRPPHSAAARAMRGRRCAASRLSSSLARGAARLRRQQRTLALRLLAPRDEAVRVEEKVTQVLNALLDVVHAARRRGQGDLRSVGRVWAAGKGEAARARRSEPHWPGCGKQACARTGAGRGRAAVHR